MEPKTKKQRFSSLSSDEIQLLIEKKDSENTQKSTKNAVATLIAYCNEISPEESPPKDAEYLEKLSKEELNELLTAFYPNARKKNGENYKKSALMGLRFGLQRHFLLKKNVDIIGDQEFAKSNQVYEAAIVELKRQGFGNVEHHNAISREDLQKIQLSYNPAVLDPKSLQRFVWFNIMFHLIRRGRENLRLLTKQSFAIKTDGTGRKFVYQAADELDKNHRGHDNADDSPGEGRMYEQDGPLCPVKAFELYLAKLNPKLSGLWQKPKAKEHFKETDEVWYCNVPVGKNTLGTLMSRISKELELSQTYTNHCIRTTAVSLLDECNFEARHIMRVSGHKSESSIRSYSRRLSEVKQKKISHSLSSASFNSKKASSSSEILLVNEARNEAEEIVCKEIVCTETTNCPRSPVLTQNFASHSQETVNFHSGAFAGANVTINVYKN